MRNIITFISSFLLHALTNSFRSYKHNI
jgi:hypothetical protein